MNEMMRQSLPDYQIQTPDPWAALPVNAESREKLWSKSRTFVGDVWFRFRSKFTSIFGFILIVLVLLFALVGPYFATFTYSEQNLDFVNTPPVFRAINCSGGYFYITDKLKVLEIDAQGHLVGKVESIAEDYEKKQVTLSYQGGEIIMDYSQSPYTMLDENGERIEEAKHIWNRTYLLGSDNLGRDMLARLMFGARVSLLVAVVAALTNLVIGVLFGSISAYCGGMVDAVMMRIVDVINTVPLTLYVILIMVVLDAGLLSIILALGTVYWVNMARVVRGEILSLKERDFVLASRTLGSSTATILFRHLIPNAMGPILVTLTMLIPSAIFMEAFLSFIGLGLTAPLASLGTMCNDALATLRTSPYQLFEPALLICILMFGFNFVGDGLRDALDPKLKK